MQSILSRFHFHTHTHRRTHSHTSYAYIRTHKYTHHTHTHTHVHTHAHEHNMHYQKKKGVHSRHRILGDAGAWDGQVTNAVIRVVVGVATRLHWLRASTLPPLKTKVWQGTVDLHRQDESSECAHVSIHFIAGNRRSARMREVFNAIGIAHVSTNRVAKWQMAA